MPPRTFLVVRDDAVLGFASSEIPPAHMSYHTTHERVESVIHVLLREMPYGTIITSTVLRPKLAVPARFQSRRERTPRVPVMLPSTTYCGKIDHVISA